jgi:DNA-binding NtrC family response regulator
VRQCQRDPPLGFGSSDASPTVIGVPAASGTRNSASGSDTVPDMFCRNLTLEEIQKRYIGHLLTTTPGNMLRAAAILDVDRRSLYRMVARYQLGTPAQHRRHAAWSTKDGASPHDAELEA